MSRFQSIKGEVVRRFTGEERLGVLLHRPDTKSRIIKMSDFVINFARHRLKTVEVGLARGGQGVVSKISNVLETRT